MNEKLKKKMALYIAALSFNYETESTRMVFEHSGVDLSPEEADEITNIAADIFDDMLKKSEGWKELYDKSTSTA